MEPKTAESAEPNRGIANLPIREAAIEDLDAVMILLAACISGLRSNGIDQWDEIYPDRSSIDSDLRAGTAFVATSDDGILGYAVLNAHQDPEYAEIEWIFPGPALVVHRLMVAPAGEGRGIGQALMKFAEVRARRLGCSSLRLDAFSGNARALRFYDRDGYRRAGQVQFRKGTFECFEKVVGNSG